MRALLLIALLSCTTSKEMAKAHMSDPASTCLRSNGKYSDISLCLSGRTLVVCNRDWCMDVPLDEAR
jgi:hypothetical protein